MKKLKLFKNIMKRALSVALACMMLISTVVISAEQISPFSKLFSSLFTTEADAAYTGTLRTDANGDFRILQVGDLQMLAPIYEDCVHLIRQAIARVKPHLIVLTGDNSMYAESNQAFENTIANIVSYFYDENGNKIPFAATLGNHDIGNNKYKESDGGAEALAMYNYYVGIGGIDYNMNSSLSVGTGFINVYGPAGSATANTVVQRVLMINSAVDDDNGGYGKLGYNEAETKNVWGKVTEGYNDEDSYIYAANAIKEELDNYKNAPVTVFQHIPLREIYTSGIITPVAPGASGSMYPYGNINDDLTFSDGTKATSYWYKVASTSTGVLNEAPCCSQSTTEFLYRILANHTGNQTMSVSAGGTTYNITLYEHNNVKGIFYGHDHGNTVTGNGTVTYSGTAYNLTQGYGGGMDLEHGTLSKAFISGYTVSCDPTNASNPNVNNTPIKKETWDSETILDDYDTTFGAKYCINYDTNVYNTLSSSQKTTLGNQSYIKKISFGLKNYDSDTSADDMMDMALERAVSNGSFGSDTVTKLKYTEDGGLVDYRANFNYGYAGSAYIALAYTRTTNPTDAYTDIVVRNAGSPPDTITKEKYGTVITYTKISDIDLNKGCGGDYLYVYATKDPKAGPPITDIQVAITYSHKYTANYGGFYSTVQYASNNCFQYPADGNSGCGSSTPYIMIKTRTLGSIDPNPETVTTSAYDITCQYYDLAKAYYQYKFKSDSYNYTTATWNNFLTAREAAKTLKTRLDNNRWVTDTRASIKAVTDALLNAVNNLELVPATGNTDKQASTVGTAKITSTVKIAVPDTIYLKIASGNATDSQFFLNNSINTSGSVVADSGTSSTGKISVKTTGDIDSVKITADRYTVSGTTFTKVSDSGYLSILDSNNASVSADAGVTMPATDENGSYGITIKSVNLGSNGLAAKSTGLIEWKITVNRSVADVDGDRNREVTPLTYYAYTVLYAPNNHSVGAISETSDYKSSGERIGQVSVSSWISGVEGLDSTQVAFGGDSNSGTVTESGSGAFAVDPIVNLNTINYKGILNSPDPDMALSAFIPSSGGNYVKGKTTQYYNYSNRKTVSISTRGYTGSLTLDPSRYTNLNQVPNLYVGTDMIGSYYHASMFNNTSNHLRTYYSVATSSQTNASNPTYGSSFSDTTLNGYTGSTWTKCTEVTDSSVTTTTGTLIVLGNTSVGFSNCHDLWAYGDAQDSGVRFYNKVESAFSASMDGYNILLACNHRNYDAYSAHTVIAKLHAVNKSTLRSGLANVYGSGIVAEWATDATKYNTFKTEMMKAALSLGTPTDTTTAVPSSLTTAQTNAANSQATSGTVKSYNIAFAKKIDSDTGLWNNTYISDAYTMPDSMGYYVTCTAYAGNWFRQQQTNIPGYTYVGSKQGGRLNNNAVSASSMTSGLTVLSSTNTMKAPFTTPGDAKVNAYHYYTGPENTLIIDMDGGKIGNGYTEVKGNIGSYIDGSTTRCVKAGYTFAGWKLVSGGGRISDDKMRYTFEGVDAEIKALWTANPHTVTVNTNGGAYSNANLIYLRSGLQNVQQGTDGGLLFYETFYGTNDTLTLHGNYNNTGTSNEVSMTTNMLAVNLTYGKVYTLSFTSTNNITEFYIYKGSMSYRSRNLTATRTYNPDTNTMTSTSVVKVSDTEYRYTVDFKVGLKDSGDDSTWSTDVPSGKTVAAYYNGEFNFRFDQNANIGTSGSFNITNMKIVEKDLTSRSDFVNANKSFVECTDATRYIGTPVRNGYKFESWTVNGTGACVDGDTLTVGTGDITLTANWTPIITTYDVNHDGINPNLFAPYEQNRTMNGVSYSYDRDTGIITLNGTHNGNSEESVFSMCEITEGYLGISLEHISGTYSSTRANMNSYQSCITIDCCDANGTLLPDVGVTRAFKDIVTDHQVETNVAAGTKVKMKDCIPIDSTQASVTRQISMRIVRNAATNITFNNFKFKIKVENMDNATDYTAFSPNARFGSGVYGTTNLPAENANIGLTRAGYTLQGWATTPSGKISISGVESSSVVNATDPIEISQTLFAQWGANTYTINYDANGGTLASGNPTTATYDQVVTIAPPTSGPNGKHFKGWIVVGTNPDYTTAMGGTAENAVTTEITSSSTVIGNCETTYFKNLSTTKNGSVTLKAQWEVDGDVNFGNEFNFDGQNYAGMKSGNSIKDIEVNTVDNSVKIIASGLNCFANPDGFVRMKLVGGHTYRISYDFTTPTSGGLSSRFTWMPYSASTGGEWGGSYYAESFAVASSEVSGSNTIYHCLDTKEVNAGYPYIAVRFGLSGNPVDGSWGTYSNIYIQDITAPDGTVHTDATAANPKIQKAVPYGSTITYPTTKPTMPGYNFEGWYTSKDATGNGTGTKYTASTKMGASSVCLYPRWVPYGDILYDNLFDFDAWADNTNGVYSNRGTAVLDKKTNTVKITPTVTGVDVFLQSNNSANNTFGACANQSVKVVKGHKYKMSFTVKNTGTKAIRAKSWIYLFNNITDTSSVDYWTWDAGSIDAGASKTFTRTITISGGNENQFVTYKMSCSCSEVGGVCEYSNIKFIDMTSMNGTEDTSITAPADEKNIPEGSTKLSATKPTMLGYRFTGWYTDRDAKTGRGTGTAVGQAGGNYTMGLSTVQLFSGWTRNSYTVKINLGSDNLDKASLGAITYTGANGTSQTYGALSGQAPDANNYFVAGYDGNIALPKPTRTGYTFAGWKLEGTNPNYTTAKYGTSASGVSNSIPNANVFYGSNSEETYPVYIKNLTSTDNGTVTLTATWTKNSYVLTVKPNGGTYNGITSNTVTSVPYRTRLSIDNPTREGYSFVGWSKSASVLGTVYMTANGYSSSMVNNSTWKGTKTEKTDTDGTQYTNYKWVIDTAPTGDTWANINFNQGYTLAEGDEVTISGKIRMNSTPLVGLKIYNGTVTNDYNHATDISSSTLNKWIDFNTSNTGKNPRKITASDPKVGYFQLYSGNAKGVSGTVLDFDLKQVAVTIKHSDGSTTVLPSQFDMPASDLTLTANWVANPYTITAEAYSNTATSQTATAGYTKSDVGGTVKVNTAAAGATSSATITYNDQTVPTYSISASPAAGYTFVGWYTDAGFTKKVPNVTTNGTAYTYSSATYVTTMTPADATYYAKFSIQSYDFEAKAGHDTATAGTFVEGTTGGTASVNYASSYYGKTVTFTATRNAGYEFLGWFNSLTDSSVVSSEESYDFTATSGKTLCAKFKLKSYYLDLNGTLDGTSGGNIKNYGTADVYVNGTSKANDCTDFYQQFRYGATYEIKDIKATKGHTYDGVASGALTGTVGAGEKNTTVNLKFHTNKYTITYNLNGGTIGSATNPTSGLLYGTEYTVTNPTKDGWNFIGWKLAGTNPDYTDAKYGASTADTQIASGSVQFGSGENTIKIKSLSSTDNGAVTLEAVWSKTVNVTYHYLASDGTMTSTTVPVTVYNYQTTTNINLKSDMPTTATVSGATYTFRGWAESATKNAAVTAAGTSVGISATKSYYASYSYNITYVYSKDTSSFSVTITQSEVTGTGVCYCAGSNTYVYDDVEIPSAVSGSKCGSVAKTFDGLSKDANSGSIISTKSSEKYYVTSQYNKYYAIYHDELSFYYYDGTSNVKSDLYYRCGISDGSNFVLSLRDTTYVAKAMPEPQAYSDASWSGVKGDATSSAGWSYQPGQIKSDSGESYNRAPLLTGVNILYAVYKKNAKLTYKGVKTGVESVPPIQSGTVYYVSNKSTTKNPTAIKFATKISATIPTLSGYTFLGWGDSSTGSATRFGGDSISLSKSKSIYAIWKNDSEDNSLKDTTNDSITIALGITADGKEKSKSTNKWEEEGWNTYSSAITSFNSAKSTFTTTRNSTNLSAWDTARTALDTAQKGLVERTVDKSAVDSFYVKSDTANKGNHSLAEINLNHYSTETLNEMKTAYTNAKGVSSTAKITAMQTTLNGYVKTMAEKYDKKSAVASTPSYKVYETTSALKSGMANWKNAGVDSSDVGVSYVMSGYSGYTYYCYTNSTNPTIALEVNEPTSATRTTYPTRSNVTPSGVADAESYNCSTETATNKYSTYTGEGMGTGYTGTINGVSYTGADYYNKKTVVTLTPDFTDSAARSMAVYTISSSDDAYEPNYANKTALSCGKDNTEKSIQDISKNTEVTPNNNITVVINYKSGETFDVTADQCNQDQWLKQYHLFRSSGGANNWEIHGIEGVSTAPYTIVDPQYGQADYCSFVYIFNYGSSTSLASNVVKLSNTSNANAAENLTVIRNLIKTTSNFNTIKNNKYSKWTGKDDGTGLGYISWPGSKSWSLNIYPQSNSYAYVHLIDRWGNSVDKIFKIPNLDALKAEAMSMSAGAVTLEEVGGSGLATASLNAGTVELIENGNATLDGNVYTTTGNTVTMYTGEPNKTYTLTASDNATNVTTTNVTTDENGYLELTVVDNDYDFNGEYKFNLGEYEVNLYSGKVKLVKSALDTECNAGEKAKIEIVTDGSVKMAQIVGAAGDTTTALSSTKNADGTRKWVISKTMAKPGEYTFKVRIKTDRVWIDDGDTVKVTVNEAVNASDTAVYSVEVSDDYGGVIEYGKHTITVVTGADTTGIRLVDKYGTTSTYTKTNATITAGDDGKQVWTFVRNFGMGYDQTFNVRTRSAYVGYADTGVVLKYNVVY